MKPVVLASMRAFFSLFFLLIVTCLYAQNGDFRLGARSAGIGGASTTITDGWSIFNNVGAMGALDYSTGLLSYQNRYDVSAFQVVGGGYVHHTDLVNAGISFFRFGDNLFNQQKMTLAVSNTFDMVSLGLGASVVQYSIETLGNQQAIVLEFGGLAALTEQLTLGAHAYNITQARLSDEETLPTVLKAGLAYTPIDALLISAEVQKDLDFDAIMKIGLEYEIIEKVWVRTGFSTEPFKSAFGAGWQWKAFQIDYAFSDQTDLGAIHELSLTYLIKKLAGE